MPMEVQDKNMPLKEIMNRKKKGQVLNPGSQKRKRNGDCKGVSEAKLKKKKVLHRTGSSQRCFNMTGGCVRQ